MRRLPIMKLSACLLSALTVCVVSQTESFGNGPEKTTPDQPGLVMQEFIYDQAPFP